jgi:hypothetical protein
VEHRGVGDDPGLAGGDLEAVGGRGELEGVGPGGGGQLDRWPLRRGHALRAEAERGPKMTSVRTDVRLAQ